MQFNGLFMFLSLVFFIGFGGLVSGELDWRLSKLLRPSSLNTVTVDQAGNGNFTTIQSAIDSVPLPNNYWIRIHVLAGVYREKVVIPKEKPFIILEGEGRENTSIVWDDHENARQSPTISLLADNFVALYISFKNSYNLGDGKIVNVRVPAVAALVDGDMSAFYSCGFFGVQDTLWDAQGRHFFKDCYIEGAVDFIFGMGQSIYEKCSIAVINAGNEGLRWVSPGFITAQGRENEFDSNGFVFKFCSVFGEGAAYLGRAWRDYSRVLFYKSYLSDVVFSKGWDAWNSTGHEDHITYAEHLCYGPGSNTSYRATWEKKLSAMQVGELISMSFIDKEGWLRKQPISEKLHGLDSPPNF